MRALSARDEYIANFEPRIYLAECYPEPDAEYRFGIRFMIRALRTMPTGLLILEFGGGPTLYTVAVLAPQAREIHFCDYVPANLAEVQRWLDQAADAFDWQPFIELILEEEGQPATSEAIADRIADMRRKVTRLTTCDACASAPLGHNTIEYDLVIARDCTDVAATTVAEWMQIVDNISSLVAPGGWLLISITTGTTINTEGQKVFSCVDLSDEDIYHGYLNAGYDPDTFYLNKITIPIGREYSGATSAIARKRNSSS